MNNFWTIYKLIDPRTSSPRYVGRTQRNIKSRLQDHWGSRNRIKTRLGKWLRELASIGLKPTVEKIEQVEDLGYSEARWIDHFTKDGHDMVNENEREYLIHEFYIGHEQAWNDRVRKITERYPDITVVKAVELPDGDGRLSGGKATNAERQRRWRKKHPDIYRQRHRQWVKKRRQLISA